LYILPTGWLGKCKSIEEACAAALVTPPDGAAKEHLGLNPSINRERIITQTDSKSLPKQHLLEADNLSKLF
jgi:hypothetical protein